ncbi:tetraspanin family protein [Ceratobasidium sp. AG-Ba]|nr:tetraspanin family protein [Ceratobasidium sp. AG-Ba]
MSSPPPGCVSVEQSLSVTSALDVPQTGVRRRVSGSHPALEIKERYYNPLGEAQKSVQQQKLPALGRELYSEDEDTGRVRTPPPAALNQARSLRPNTTNPAAYEEPISRFPTPNFAEASKDSGRMNDSNMFGLLSKLTGPFRVVKAQSILGSGVGGKVVDEECGISLEENATSSAGALEFRSIHPIPARPPSIPLRDGSLNNHKDASTQSLPTDAASIRLVVDSKDTSNNNCTKSEEPFLDREPPRSPALLASIHRATDRFTRRFPVSMSYRKANGKGEGDDRHLLGLLGYGDTGAIVEWPNAWTPEKWSLLLSVCSVFLYGLTGLVLVLLTWFGGESFVNDMIALVLKESSMAKLYDNAHSRLRDPRHASLIVLGTSIFGICGTLLNNRPLLAVYCVLLWPSFVGILVIGYSAYRRAAFALPNKLDQAWSQKWGSEDRLVLQYSLHCCGYWSPEHEATLSPLCYPRALLPGCRARLLRFERANLRRYYTWVFSLVPLHVLNIVTAILCSNHVNRLFGKGLTPWKYRLSIADVRANALHVLETYRDTIVPPQPNRVYALRSRHLKDGTSRSPRIPQGSEEWTGRMPYEESVGSMFGFRGGAKMYKQRMD